MPRGKGQEAPGVGASNGSICSIESKELPYFYSNFSNTDEVADFLLHKSKCKSGFFLVRPSFRNRQALTVSVVVEDKTVRHTNIIVEGTGALKKYYLVKEKKFDSVDELIVYYREHDVKNLQKVSRVRFLHPLNRPIRYSESGSGGSYHTIGSQDSGGHIASSGQNERPPLPARPSNLQRFGSQESFNSHMSVLSGNSGTPLIGEGASGGQHRGSNPSIGRDGSFHSNWTLGPANSFPTLPSPTLPSPTDSVDKRPPAPIPQIPISASGNLYYSSPRNVDQSIKEELKKVIRESERCDCGIPRDLSDLPLGWTVHRSKDSATYGRLFYQNEAGLTSWKLPEEVNKKLTVQHQTNLKKVKMMKFNDDYLESNVPSEFAPQTPTNRSDGSGSGAAGNRFSNTQF